MSILNSNSDITTEWLERNGFTIDIWEHRYSASCASFLNSYYCYKNVRVISGLYATEVTLMYFPSEFEIDIYPFNNKDIRGCVIMVGDFSFNPTIPICKPNDVDDIILFANQSIMESFASAEVKENLIKEFKWQR